MRQKHMTRTHARFPDPFVTGRVFWEKEKRRLEQLRKSVMQLSNCEACLGIGEVSREIDMVDPDLGYDIRLWWASRTP